MHQGKAEGSTDGRDLSQRQAALSFPRPVVSGTLVVGKFGPHGDRWSEASLGGFLASSLRWPEARLATRTIVLAAVVTLSIAIAAAVVTSMRFSFTGAVIVAIGASAAVSIATAAFARFRQVQSPPPPEEQAAALRIQAIVSSLLERYGMEEPEINPPVKLIDTSGAPIGNDLDRRLAVAQTTSSEFFLSQFVDRPRLTVILGESGAGKTSLLLRLTHRMLLDRSEDRRDLIPLFFKCRDWTDEYDSFYKWVIATAQKSYGIPVHISDYWIRSGRLFIALDGLHELPPDCFAEFSGAINSWIQAAEGTRLAISSTMQPGIADLVRSLGVDQLCVIQPLPDSDIQRSLDRTLSRLNFRDDVPAVQAMDRWMQGLISRNSHLRGPALVGLLAEAIGESEQLPDDGTQRRTDSNDPADVAFLVANSFFSRSEFGAARDAYSAITRLPHSRWHVPAYTLLATCLYLLGDVNEASDKMIESVALRLQESIRATPDAVEPLSKDELQCLAAVPFDTSLDIVQISSAASLPLSRSRQVLQTLRERGLIETVANTGDMARFRRSATATTSR
jgi:NACHT domain